MSYENSMPATLRAIAADLDQMVDGGICYTALDGHAKTLRGLRVRLDRLYAHCAHELIRERVVAVRGCLDFLESLIDASRASEEAIVMLSSVLECMAGEASNDEDALIALDPDVIRFPVPRSRTQFRRPGGSAA